MDLAAGDDDPPPWPPTESRPPTSSVSTTLHSVAGVRRDFSSETVPPTAHYSEVSDRRRLACPARFGWI